MPPCILSLVMAVAFGMLCLVLFAVADTDLAEEKYGVKYASKCEGNGHFRLLLQEVTLFLLQTVYIVCVMYA